LTDQLVFLQMQKTACSHISEILKDYFNGKQIGKHGPLTFDPGDRRILGSIRNPYDWYVSLWSYGCIGKGAIHSRLTNSRGSAIRRLLRERVRRPADWPVLAPILRAEVARDPRQFRALYNDPNDRSCSAHGCGAYSTDRSGRFWKAITPSCHWLIGSG
jgi:hypothetical protein